MAIEYLEIRGTNREVIGILDMAKSIIWHKLWYGVGDFEIYAKATDEHLQLLDIGKYVTRIDDSDVGIIENITITHSVEDGTMITASGRFAKSILDRRLIYNLSGTTNKATVLSGKVENAVRALVANNAISCTFDTKRNYAMLELGALANIPTIIVDDYGNAAQKQVSYENLLEYTDALLEEYQLSASIILDDDTKKLQYIVKQGVDRSADNTEGNEPVVFSRDFDNLTSTEYYYDVSTKKNVALIGGQGEGLERFYSQIAPSTLTGLDRREVFVNASDLAKEYKDESEVTHTYTDAEYTEMLNTKGKQKLAQLTPTETFQGTILATSGNYIVNQDFAIGDFVTVQENSIGKYINIQISEITEVQDESGYSIEAVYR